MIPIYKPFLNSNNLKYAHDALDSTWVSSQGKYINLVKDKIKELFGYKYIILTNNGTSATHLLSIGLKYKYPEIDTLVVPNNVYVAAINSFKMNPIYNFKVIDSNIDTWNGDYGDLEENNACLIVHNIASVVNVPELKKKYPNTIFVEDNCEGFTGKYNGEFTGSVSLLSSVSFFGNKTLTSGEGGMVVTENEEIFNFLNSVRNQGNTDTKFVFDKLGYNYRMTNIQAAILLGQLESIDEIKQNKERIFEEYKKELLDVPSIKFQLTDNNTEMSNWMFAIRINGLTEIKRKELELHLYNNEIETRPIFPPITYHKHFLNLLCNNKNSKILYESVLILPSYPELSTNQVTYICAKIKNFLKNEKI